MFVALPRTLSRDGGLLTGVEDPTSGCPEEQHGGSENDDEEYPGEGGSVAHVEVFEGVVIEVESIDERGVCRTALGHDIRLREILEVANETDDDVEEDDRGDERQRDRKGAANGAGNWTLLLK